MSRVTFITGASSGIGSSLATLMARDSAVALAARREPELEELAAQIRSNGGTALPIACDVTDRTMVHAAIERCERELGPIDCLIANAGIGGTMTPTEFNAEITERVLRTNLLGPIYCIEAVLPGMIKRKTGQIVGISSLASIRGLPDAGSYCASKSGLDAFLECLRISVRHYGIAVTTVNPGFVKTPMTARNRNPMPFLLEQEEAAHKICEAIRKKKRTYSFPWQLAWIMKVARLVPDGLYDRAFSLAKVKKDR